jgi:hypothetical protein
VHETGPYTRDPGPNLHKTEMNRPQTYGVYANPPHPEAEDHRVWSMHIGEEFHKTSHPEASSSP